MAEYIRRLAALKALERYNGDVPMEIFWLIRDVPAANVEPVRHGRWCEPKGGFWKMAKCSLCGEWQPTAGIIPKYCPNCGAKMDLEEEP